MSTAIGGIDVTFRTARAGFRTSALLDALLDFWPQCQFQVADESQSQGVVALLAVPTELDTPEFFVYRDAHSVGEWQRLGSSPENANTMLHFLIEDDPADAKELQVTLVVDDFTPEVSAIVEALLSALATTGDGPPGNGVSSRINYDAQLRELGYGFDRHQFYDLLDETRRLFYSTWTADELACHPHEAQLFCEIVRKRCGAPVPDHIVMKGLFNSRKRKRPLA